MSVYKFGGYSKKETPEVDLETVYKVVEEGYFKRDGSSGATGPLNMNDNKISKVVDPEDDQDVATKSYVDAKSRISNADGNKVLVSTARGDIVESRASVDTLKDGIRSALSRIGNIQHVLDRVMMTPHHDFGVLRGSEYTSQSKNLFPLDLVASTGITIVGLSVVMKYTGEDNENDLPKWLDVTTIVSSLTGTRSYALIPIEKLEFTLSCSHVLSKGDRYNVALRFMNLRTAKLMDIAFVKVYYTYNL